MGFDEDSLIVGRGLVKKTSVVPTPMREWLQARGIRESDKLEGLRQLTQVLEDAFVSQRRKLVLAGANGTSPGQ
jgi:hypothetical protein